MNELHDNLVKAIEDKDSTAVLSALSDIENELLVDKDVANWVASPPIITNIHKLLMEKMNIPQRLLQLRNRVPSTHRRAVMFIRIMAVAVKRVHGE